MSALPVDQESEDAVRVTLASSLIKLSVDGIHADVQRLADNRICVEGVFRILTAKQEAAARGAYLAIERTLKERNRRQ